MIEDFETSSYHIPEKSFTTHLPSKRQALRRLYDAQVLLQSYEDYSCFGDGRITWCNMVYSNQRKDAEQDSPILNLGVADDFSTFLLIFLGVAVANYVFKYTLW